MPRPPNDRGQGRKPLPPGEKLVVITFRGSETQKAKFAKLGGGPWIRPRIDRAKV